MKTLNANTIWRFHANKLNNFCDTIPSRFRPSFFESELESIWFIVVVLISNFATYLSHGARIIPKDTNPAGKYANDNEYL